MTEIWKRIPGWSFYEASNFGRIRRKAGWTPKGRGRRYLKEHILVPCEPRASVGLYDGAKKRNRCSGHFVLLAFKGPPKTGQWLRHLDDNPWNNKLSNLAWGSRLENASDALRNGRYKIGAEHPRTKLCNEIVLKIRAEYQRNTRNKGSTALAKRYSIDPSSVRSIVTRKTWTHI